jgi:hypothetical protein
MWKEETKKITSDSENSELESIAPCNPDPVNLEVGQALARFQHLLVPKLSFSAI